MRKFYIASILILLSILLYADYAYPQGCSDAGFCTQPVLDGEPQDHATDKKNSVSIGIGYGVGDQDVKVTTLYLSFNRRIDEKLAIAGKVTYGLTDGELGANSGIGDLFLSGSYQLLSSQDRTIQAIVGCKIPLGDANAKENGLALPMTYQNSLGSYDLNLGGAYSINDLTISVGLQLPISISTDNGFLPSNYTDQSTQNYPSTNKFERKGDLLVRLSYEFDLFNEKLNLRPSLLPIVHLGEDTYIDDVGQKRNIKGSDGLTLNGNLNLSWKVGINSTMEFIFATPFITRDVRPDGLTRHFVIGCEYSYSF